MNKCIVIVLEYNGLKDLPTLMTALDQQVYKDFDLLVIDNKSSDGSVQFLKANYPNIKLQENKENLGYAGAYAQAIPAFLDQYEYIVLLNTDTKPDTHWLEQLIATADRRPDAGAIGSAIVDKDGILSDGAGGYLVNFITGSNAGLWPGKDSKELPQEAYEIFYASGCAMMLRSAALKKVGVLDTRYFIYYEEIDLCWRLFIAGYKVLCEPKSLVTHYGTGVWATKPKVGYFTERNRLVTYYKNLSSVSLLWEFPLLVISRFALSLALFVSFPHFKAKLRGIFDGLVMACNSGRQRKSVQQIRKVTDAEVISFNRKFSTPVKVLISMMKVHFAK
jgi:GT2 family glycosyltransferase